MQAGAAQLRGCYFDPDAGVGVFARLPVTGDQQGSQQSVVGFRYGSGNLSAGFICQPLVERLTHLWLVLHPYQTSLGHAQTLTREAED